MSAGLEQVGDFTSFAYNGRRGKPWHLLGVEVDGNQTADEMLRLAKADYEVFTLPIFAQGAVEQVEIPNRFVTARISPHTGELEVWEVVAGRYTVHQNSEVLERALEVVHAANEPVIDTVGVLDNGRKFFATIDLDPLIIDPLGIGDKIERNLIVDTSHDGSSPIRFINSMTRVVCANTLAAARADARATFTARHTPNAEARMNEAAKVLGFSTAWAESFKAMADEMLAITVTPKSQGFDRVLDAIWPAADADTDRKRDNRDKIVGSVAALWANERNAGFAGYNGWTLYNALTEREDWYRGVPVTESATDAMNPTSTATKRKLLASQAVLALAN